LTNCLLIDNVADNQPGGALYLYRSYADLINCTLSRNSASNAAELYVYHGSNSMWNCIVWDCTADAIQVVDYGLDVGYSNVPGPWPGEGNIDAYPQFVGGYYLAQVAAGQSSTSPCVDAGDPASDSIDRTTRTDGLDDDGIPDMGYHYPGAACLGDFDGDGVRDLSDFTLFASVFGLQLHSPRFDPHADLNGDGVVDLSDFILFANGFGAACP
jgi:hypothetical protein